MKVKTFLGLIVCVILLSTVSRGDDASVAQFPKAALPVTSFRFQEAVEGTEIAHDFVILNKGTAPLNIKKIDTG